MKKKSLAIIIIGIILLVFSFGFFDIDSVIGLSNQKKQVKIMEEPKPVEIIVEEPRIENIDILACGDMMFHMPQVNSAHKGNGIYDFKSVFEYVKPYIVGADIALTNFESVTLGDEFGFSGFPTFNSPKATLEAIKDAGFDIISTANNHSLDRGKKGIIATLEEIERLNLKAIGTSKTPNIEILIEERDGIRVGFLSYTYGLNGLDTRLTKEELSYMVNLIDEERIQEDIGKIKAEVDLLVVFIHWGHEYHREASEFQIDLGHKMVEWGANVIFGSHPHVIQETEIVEHNGKENIIIYSMGNFFSNQSLESMGNSYTEDGIMVNLNIEKNFDTGHAIIKEVTYIPTWVYKYRENNRYTYKILPLEDIINGDLNLNLNESIFSRVEKSFRDTLDRVEID